MVSRLKHNFNPSQLFSLVQFLFTRFFALILRDSSREFEDLKTGGSEDLKAPEDQRIIISRRPEDGFPVLVLSDAPDFVVH